jgi:uncharacterized protein
LALVLDTTVVVAALDASDTDHQACLRLLSEAEEDLIIPVLVLSEVDYWCDQRLGLATWLVFMADLLEGAYRVEHPTQADLERARDLQQTYADMRVGVVDASVLALVERFREPKLATLDRRHFSVMRPRHVSALHLLPE